MATLYAVGDGVAFGGTSYVATVSESGLEPDLYPADWGVLAQGVAGPTGPTGTAATVSVGTVTTGVAGSAASVTNSGTTGAAVLNFAIPQGSAGGNSILSMYHTVSFTTIYYSVTNPAASASESATVLTWVAAACTATTLSVFSQQGNPVTVTLRNGTSSSMANTALSCVATTNGSCTVTGSVAVTSGSFLDLSIAGANGSPSGVWTAVGCS